MANLLESDSEEELMEMAAMAAADVAIVGSVTFNDAQRMRKLRSMWVRPIFERRRECWSIFVYIRFYSNA
jgi:hypothetical protein